MKPLKNTIIESSLFLGTCGLLLVFNRKGVFKNIDPGFAGAIPGMIYIMIAGSVFIPLILYLIHREMKRNPDYREKRNIEIKDERKIYLKDKANSQTYAIFDIIEFPISLILLFTGLTELGFGLMILHFVKRIIQYNIHSTLSKKY